MRFYEVLVADSKYHSSSPLVYASGEPLDILSVVTIPLRNRAVTGFVTAEVQKPSFKTKEIKSTVFTSPLPYHCLQLAQWMADYYGSTLSEALKQFAPSKPSIRQKDEPPELNISSQIGLNAPLTKDQKGAINAINSAPSTTVLLHGETGTGKTRVYLELALQTLKNGKSVIMLTPEVSLTSQLARVVKQGTGIEPFIMHSYLSQSERKKIWKRLIELDKPAVIVGTRSALFSPVKNPGLIVLDESHEPAYKQEQAPRYHAARVASQLGVLTGAKVVLGTATPSITDYYLADKKSAVIRMTELATAVSSTALKVTIVDIKNRQNFGQNPHISKTLTEAISTTLSARKQIIIYLNRRGSARIILCRVCGWQLLCPNCDIPLVYHGDEHLTRCHTCGYSHTPPAACLKCNSTDIIYRSIGTKALTENLSKLFPQAIVKRFDSDNPAGEQLNDQYLEILKGNVDILVGTQLLAKGLDLPRLALVGIISVEASLTLPDYTSEERAFQLLYQVVGRVGRGHIKGEVIIQTYEPESMVVKAASERDWLAFYKHTLVERQQFRFPPYSYLLKLVCRRGTKAGAEVAAHNLKENLTSLRLPVEIIGPSESFHARRGRYYYYQLVAKSKNRDPLVQLAAKVPAGWSVDLDPIDLL